MQAKTQHNGETLYRWYVYETDGHRRVVWAADREAALRKAWRNTRAMLTDYVDAAPPAGTDSAHYARVPRPAGDPIAHL